MSTAISHLPEREQRAGSTSTHSITTTPQYTSIIAEIVEPCIAQYRHHLHRVIGRKPITIDFTVEEIGTRLHTWARRQAAERSVEQSVRRELQARNISVAQLKVSLRRSPFNRRSIHVHSRAVISY